MGSEGVEPDGEGDEAEEGGEGGLYVGEQGDVGCGVGVEDVVDF